MSKTFLNWSECLENGVSLCGGKGFNLARLSSFEFPIPKGGVLSSKIYRNIIKREKISAKIHQAQQINDAQLNTPHCTQLLSDIRKLLKSIVFSDDLIAELRDFLVRENLHDKALAIRSSATKEDGEKHSFAGIHKSFLNVQGMENILAAILNCYASLWTPQAIAYRRKMAINDTGLYCAVVITELLDAQASGIAFSCDPGTGREDLSLINANFGYGESIVGGQIEPDEYRLSSHHMAIDHINIGSKSKLTQLLPEGGTQLCNNKAHQQVLAEQQIIKLGEMVQRVFWTLSDGEQHQDIEWVYDGQQFYLVQTRPVTHFSAVRCDALAGQEEFWSNGNFRDAAPMVQGVLEASLFPHHINNILTAPFNAIGYQLPAGIRFVKLFQGRAYLNIALLQWVYYNSSDYLPSATNQIIGGHQNEIKLDKIDAQFHHSKLAKLSYGFKLLGLINRYKKNAQRYFKQVDEFTHKIRTQDMRKLENEQICQQLLECDKKLTEYGLTFASLTASSGAITNLSDLLEKYLPGQGIATANHLMAGAGNITSAEQGYQLQSIADIIKTDPSALTYFQQNPFFTEKWQELPNHSSFKQAFSHFLDKYGHRAAFEGDFSHPRWREDPGYLLSIIRSYLNSPSSSVNKEEQNLKTQQLRQSLKNKLPFYIRPLVNFLINQSVRGAELREMAKSQFIRQVEPARLLYLEAARRFKKQDYINIESDIFDMSNQEIITLLRHEWQGQGLKNLITTRQNKKQALEQIPAPDLIVENQAHYIKPKNSVNESTLQGMGVSGGYAEGKARLVLSPEQAINIQPGEILVAPSTDPGWTPLFLNAAAVVVETGGQLSHGAIVAREYGIPAVANIAGLFNVLKDQDLIAVDGDRGLVTKI